MNEANGYESNRENLVKKVKTEEPAGFFFHGSPGAPDDFRQILQNLEFFRNSSTQRDFLTQKIAIENFLRFDFYVGYSYGCRVLIDLMNEIDSKHMMSSEAFKRKKIFLIAPCLTGESKALQKSLVKIPLLGKLILDLKREKIAIDFAKKVAEPFEPASRLLESVERYSSQHFKNALFEKKEDAPRLEFLKSLKTFCLVPELDTTIDAQSTFATFSKLGKAQMLPGASHSCLWTHAHAIAEWIAAEYFSQ